ncbi:MAG: DEAD/DEAH box helicase [Bacteroidota bacterium]
MTFSELNLNGPLLNALADLDYVDPTPIQQKAFPIIMSGRNVVGIAQTGTGKTFAYLLPLLRQLTFSEQKDPRILILAPTRELVIQIVGEVEKLLKYTHFRFAGVYGGANINMQKKVVYNGLDVIVATPGRLLDLALSGVLQLKSIQKLVIDEVDEMLGLGFRTQLTNLLELLPVRRQNLMFSATLNPDVEALIANSMPAPVKIEITAHGTPIEKIVQRAFHVPNFNTKVNLLKMLLDADPDMTKVLVFTATKKLADRLFEQAELLFPGQVSVIHSNKSHNNRLDAIKQLQQGTKRLLIATDIIARGMDIMDVSHVINFDMPDVPGDYIHRLGRTGRADKDGIAISFINQTEREYQENIEQMMNMAIPMEALPEGIVISDVYYEEERIAPKFDKNYRKEPSIKDSQGAFHEKKGKNMKVNLGCAWKRNPKFTKTGKRIKNRPR